MYVLKRTVLFKIWQFPLVSETFILAQIITAIKSGYEVKILVQDLFETEPGWQQDTFDSYNFKKKIIIDDPRIPDSRVLKLIKGMGLILLNLPDFRKMISFIKADKRGLLDNLYRFQFYKQFRKVDIIHVQYGTNVKPFDTFKKTGIFSSKLIVSFHGHDAFFPINGIVPNNGYYDDLFKHGNMIVANTPYLAAKLEELGFPKNKIKIIPVGVDTKFFQPNSSGRNGKKLKLISIGRLDKVKGHKHAIEVMDLLLSNDLNVSLTIIGEGAERKNLQELITLKKLHEDIFLVGKKDHFEIKNYFQEHDIYILPAVAVENNRQETQGLATLEAQACGIPAVVFNSGGVKYTVKDGTTGFVVREGDIVAMAEKIEELINNVTLWEEMSRAAIVYVEENFSQTKIDAVWCREYEQLTNNR